MAIEDDIKKLTAVHEEIAENILYKLQNMKRNPDYSNFHSMCRIQN